MTTIRNSNQIKQRAHMILDQVKAGIYHDQKAINWALAILGEPIHSK